MKRLKERLPKRNLHVALDAPAELPADSVLDYSLIPADVLAEMEAAGALPDGVTVANPNGDR